MDVVDVNRARITVNDLHESIKYYTEVMRFKVVEPIDEDIKNQKSALCEKEYIRESITLETWEGNLLDVIELI